MEKIICWIKKMEQALNNQLNAEMASGYLYLSMATYFEDNDLPGFGNALKVHAQEELEHAMKFYDYILRKGGSVVLQAIDTPKRDWKNTVEVYEEILEREELVTSLIHDLVNLSINLRIMPLISSCYGLLKNRLKKKNWLMKI